ncbi:MAG TPA: N-acetyltransferase [Bryobacteraceae bacterium]|nr:N-acetyltransferase [Bryobacteraceae bacterium]
MISGLTPDFVAEKKTANMALEIRKARMQDIAPVVELINGYAARGIMLPRTEFEISEHIRDFSVASSEGRFVGCGALHFYSPTVAEIRSVAVAESAKTHGVGRKLVDALVDEAQQYALDAVFAFTYVADFFRKLGFEEVERGELPLKAWKDCLRCPKFQCCDEVAMVRILRPDHWLHHPPKWAYDSPLEGEAPPVVLPIVQKKPISPGV